jgi:hypothetical protein
VNVDLGPACAPRFAMAGRNAENEEEAVELTRVVERCLKVRKSYLNDYIVNTNI